MGEPGVIEDLYCKLYVDVSGQTNDLVRSVAALDPRAQTFLRSVETTVLHVDVIPNEDADVQRATASDGFLHYPYYLEIGPRDDTEIGEEQFVVALRKLMAHLRSSGMRVTASCSFEDQLEAT
jgi:hypothetical protein